jgi:uncharacterized protein YbjT (DUF2867 family)
MACKILLTGVTGTIGRFLVGRLAADGVQIQVSVRSSESAASFKSWGIETFICDFNQPETLPPALAGVEKLFLLSVAHPRQVEMQGNMVEAARQAGVRHIVKLSASCAGPDLPTPIKRWHYETEQQIKRSGIPYTFLRPNCFMQNTLKWARTIREESFFRMPVGEAVVSQVDARDIASVAAAILTGNGHEGQTYEITGPEALSYEEVSEHLSLALGKVVRYLRTSYKESREHMIEAGMEEWLADAVTETYRFMSDGSAAHVTDVVAQVTGHEPLRFSQFSKDYTEAFK